MQFAVTSVPHGCGQALRLTGELDIATVALLRSAVESALARRPPVLLLDLSSTAFLDSTGCSELVRAGKSGRAAGVPVQVVVPPGNWKVRRVIDFVQLGELLPVHDELPPVT